jgi:hypothetical protein
LDLEREELTGGWRKLESGELHNLHCSPNIRVIIVKENVLRMGEVRYKYRILVGKI